MTSVNESNDGYGVRKDNAKFKHLKPVMFEYSQAQKSGDFDDISYDYVDDVNKIRGKTIVACSELNAASLTKTRVQRESDDSPTDNLIGTITKTAIQSEDGDTSCSQFLYAATKTLVERESDDDMDSCVLLLTKTEVTREADE